jgi:hypothetical protein
MGVMKRIATGASIGRSRSGGGFVDVRFEAFLDRKGVLERIGAKRAKVLNRVGGFARTAMKRSIRAPLKSKKARTVVVGGKACYVPIGRGKVLDAATGQPVTTRMAQLAHLAMRDQLKSDGAGLPPRRGALDLLRKHIYYSYDEPTESVVIAPLVFTKQPPLIGASSVPELLEFGGKELFHAKGHAWTGTYSPHPFVRPILPLAEAKLAEEIERTPL